MTADAVAGLLSTYLDTLDLHWNGGANGAGLGMRATPGERASVQVEFKPPVAYAATAEGMAFIAEVKASLDKTLAKGRRRSA